MDKDMDATHQKQTTKPEVIALAAGLKSGLNRAPKKGETKTKLYWQPTTLIGLYYVRNLSLNDST